MTVQRIFIGINQGKTRMGGGIKRREKITTHSRFHTNGLFENRLSIDVSI